MSDLSNDGTRRDYTFVLEDLEHITAPTTGTGDRDYRSILERQALDCDREVARCFMAPRQ